MRHYLKLLTVLSTGTLLGCSSLSQAPTKRELQADAQTSVFNRVKSVEYRPPLSAEIENLWLQGRLAQGQGQLARAEAHYAQILKKQPTHPSTLNALAVIYAQTDRLDQAIRLLEQALALQPQASHLFNNLGYALLLAGRLDEAETALNRAQALNPSSTLTQQNKALLAQARQRGATLLAEPAAPATEAVHEGATLVAVAPNVYELRIPAPAPLSSATAQSTTSTTSAAAAGKAVSATVDSRAVFRGVRLEVSNGVGVRHLARRTAERLATLGVVTTRLTNQPGYQQMKTELQFNTMGKSAAQALVAQLPQAPRMVAGQHLYGNVQLRLVLGHDQVGQAMLSWLDTPAAPDAAPAPESVPPVALNPRLGWRWG
jgi:hypothetical protein